MKHSIVGMALVAALSFSGAVVSGDLRGPVASGSPIVVAHADASNATRGIVQDENGEGTCPWNYTSDGVMHIGAGTLPPATRTVHHAPFGDYYSWTGTLAAILGALSNDGHVVKTISFDGPVKAPENASHLFYQLNMVNNMDVAPQIKNLNRLDVSETTNMTDMFASSGQLAIDVSSFDTSKVTSMQEMFDGNNNLTSNIVGLDHFDTSQVTDMGKMFNEIGDGYHDVKLDLSHFDVSKVHHMDYVDDYGDNVSRSGFDKMFYLNGKTVTIDLSGWKPQVPLDNLMGDGTHLSKITLSPDINLTDTSFPQKNSDGTSALDQKWENIRDLYSADPNKKTYNLTDIATLYQQGSLDKPTTDETYVMEPDVTPGNPVTIHYVDQDGKTIQADTQLPGDLGATYTVKPATIAGYHYVKATDGSLTGTYTSDPQSVTLTYKAVPKPSPSESSSSSDSANTKDPDQVKMVAKKDRAITAVKKLGFYHTTEFSRKTRQYYYAKQKRTLRPQFVITGVARSKSGFKRYLVRDVTPGSKRYGMTGYMTAKRAFTVHTYYQHAPKQVKVIQGTNAYRDKALKKHVRHLKRGTVLRVKKLVRYHLTTRLVLNDGSYVTSNKEKVIEK